MAGEVLKEYSDLNLFLRFLFVCFSLSFFFFFFFFFLSCFIEVCHFHSFKVEFMYLVFVFLAGMPGESFRRRSKVFVVVFA